MPVTRSLKFMTGFSINQLWRKVYVGFTVQWFKGFLFTKSGIQVYERVRCEWFHVAKTEACGVPKRRSGIWIFNGDRLKKKRGPGQIRVP